MWWRERARGVAIASRDCRRQRGGAALAETDIDMLSVGAPDFIAALEDAVSKREVTG